MTLYPFWTAQIESSAEWLIAAETEAREKVEKVRHPDTIYHLVFMFYAYVPYLYIAQEKLPNSLLDIWKMLRYVAFYMLKSAILGRHNTTFRGISYLN